MAVIVGVNKVCMFDIFSKNLNRKTQKNHICWVKLNLFNYAITNNFYFGRGRRVRLSITHLSKAGHASVGGSPRTHRDALLISLV